jgi:hypothetical protein
VHVDLTICSLEYGNLFGGDIFVVVSYVDNDEKVKYYLMRCTGKKNEVIGGYFFKKLMKLKVMFTFKTINQMS